MKFTELNLKPQIERALASNDRTEATPIQSEIIPLVLENIDVIGQSHTGSGKTLAFVLPSLQRIDPQLKSPQYLIVCPTRELANQVLNEVRLYSKFMEGVTSALVCGGSNISNQIFALKRANIVVGTPGRIMDHLQRRTLKLQAIKTIILDEADEILKMGFKNEIDFIFQSASQEHQTILFSATISKEILVIANTYQKDPKMIKIEDDRMLQNNIEQIYVNVNHSQKEQAFLALIKEFNPRLCIVFCNTKTYTDQIAGLLRAHKINAGVLNGDKRQSERFHIMDKFKTGHLQILVATDVAARGLDVTGIDYIFNYDLPLNTESYIHRIGRTARAGAKGVAVSFVTNQEQYNLLHQIEEFQSREITERIVEGFEPTRHYEYSTKRRFAGSGNGGGKRYGGGNGGYRGGNSGGGYSGRSGGSSSYRDRNANSSGRDHWNGPRRETTSRPQQGTGDLPREYNVRETNNYNDGAPQNSYHSEYRGNNDRGRSNAGGYEKRERGTANSSEYKINQFDFNRTAGGEGGFKGNGRTGGGRSYAGGKSKFGGEKSRSKFGGKNRFDR